MTSTPLYLHLWLTSGIAVIGYIIIYCGASSGKSKKQNNYFGAAAAHTHLTMPLHFPLFEILKTPLHLDSIHIEMIGYRPTAFTLRDY